MRLHALLYLRDYLWTPLTFWKVSQTVVRGSIGIPVFHFLFWVFGETAPVFLVRVGHFALMLDLEVNLRDVLDESCDSEDEIVPEFDGNTGQQEVRSLPFCIICSLVWSIVVVYRWPTHKYIRVLCRVDRTADVSSSNDPVTKWSRSWTCTCASTFVCTSPLARYHRCGVPGSPQSLHFVPASFLFAHHVHWCSGVSWRPALPWLRKDSKNAALSVFFWAYRHVFAKSHATLQAHLSWCKVSSRVLSANLGAHGLRSWKFTLSEWRLAMDLSCRELWCGATCFYGVIRSRFSFFPWNRSSQMKKNEDTKPNCIDSKKRLLNLSHDFSSTFCWAAHQPQRVGIDTCRHICILCQTWK